MPATKAMIEYAGAIANTLKIDEPDFENYMETSCFINQYSETFKKIKKQERTVLALQNRYGEFDTAFSQEFYDLLDEMHEKHGVYMFREFDKIVYIGKSVDLQGRVFSSLKERLPYSDITSVVICYTPTIADMHLLEIYLIEIFKPELNKDCACDDMPTLFKADLKGLKCITCSLYETEEKE